MDDLVQSTAFMPPIADGMDTCHVFLFGDQTVSFEQDLQRLLHVKDNDTLRSFFAKVGYSLRKELSSLPAYQQDWFPRFTTVIDLLSKLDETEGSPVLKFTLLCLCEIGQFIRYYGEGSRLYPHVANTYLLGLCTGSFAAAAISTSQTLSELVPAGVEAVLVAFRTALHSFVLRCDLENPISGTPRSWSVVVSLKEADVTSLIERFCLEKGLPGSSKLYLSSVMPNNLTISGPPSVLQEFLATHSLKAYHLPIELPYHAFHLFDPADVDEIVGEFHDAVLQSYKPRFLLLSAASGEIITADGYKSLLHRIVSDTLQEPLRWDKILQKFTDKVSSQDFKQCMIYPLSSTSGPLLSSTLTKNTNIQVSINNVVGSVSPSLPSSPTGKFDQSKIAIIGYSGRFPDAASNEEFWDLLHAGLDVHRTIPEDRFDWKTHFDPTGKKKNTSRVQYGCFIKEPGLFDTRFFNMSPRESENTDPAQRLAITTTYEAIEMAGLVPNRTPSTQQDRIGVFFGITSDDWREVNSGQNVDTYFIPGGNRAFVPGRISYFFRFCGPSLSIDTACSSSFAAIQTACAYLWRGECDTAVAGGTNVLTNPDNFCGLDRGHFLSTTGNCNSFDDGADGYCRSDAVGSVILKRLEDAEADNDPIFGVIAGAYTNHCGQTDSITRPHEGDQSSVFKRIMRHAGVNPLDISYVEMHGTGTQAGDATEMSSVLSVFVPGHERMPRFPLYLGSAKANIGHAESASGVSSLIKVLMMMKHSEIPPHCGIKTKINHNYPLDLNDRNVNIAFQPVCWSRENCHNGKRTVFLNNFSAAGGNTAVLLEDAPPPLDIAKNDPRTAHVIAVSAKTPKSLKENIDAMIGFLEKNSETYLAALSYTTTARRVHHNYRAMCTGSDAKSLRESLKARLSGPDAKPIPNASKVPKVVFVFTGQGSFYTGVGRQLFESLSPFRADVLRFNGIARRQGFPSFRSVIEGTLPESDNADPVITHLALTCVQMALSRLWVSWGIKPSATTGHSLGEYAALYAAGVLTANEVIYLVGTRAQLLSTSCSKGTHSMLAIKAPLDVIKPLLTGSPCEVACINQPTSNVISGPDDEINALVTKCQSRGHECVKLDIPFAFHSAQVDPILKPFEAAAGSIRYKLPAIPYISPLLGQIVSDSATVGASYLSRACRNIVNFQGALEAAKAASIVDDRTIWLEIGSHPACSGMVKGTLGSQMLTSPSLRRGTDTWKVITSGLESFYFNGIEIDWNEYHRDFKGSQRVIELPRYRWDLKNYWIMYRNDFCLTKGDNPEINLTPAAVVEELPAPVYVSPSVQRVLEEHNAEDISTLLIESDINDPRLSPVIQGHKVNGVALCPSSLYADIAMTIVEYMLKANSMQTDRAGMDVADVKVDKPLIAITGKGPQLLRVSASADWATNVVSISLYSVNAGGKKLSDHATCKLRLTPNQTWLDDWKRSSYLIQSRITSLNNAVNDGDSHKIKRGMVYKLFGAVVDYDTRYQGMQEVVLDSNQLEATARVSFQVSDDGFFLNPCWIDSLGHIAGFIMNGNDNVQSKTTVFINHGWDRMRCSTKFSRDKVYQTYNRMQLVSGTLYAGDTYILEEGKIIAIFEGVKFQGVPRQVLDHLLPSKTAVSKNAPNASTTIVSTKAKPIVAPAAQTSVKDTPKPVVPSRAIPTASSNSIFPRVLSIISQEAGIDPSDLGPNDEFGDYGIDSLLSLTICGRLQEELDLDLPSSLFADFPTVKDLSSFLQGNDNPPSSQTSSIDSKDIPTPVQDSDVDVNASDYETGVTSPGESSDVLEIIRATIAEETGVSVADVLPSTSFAELGVDSLLGLNIIGKLNELEIDVPSTLMSESDTMDEIQAALGLKSKAPKNSSPVKPEPELAQALVDTPPHSTSILLQGNPKTASKVLFLFPDGAGSATSYASLAKISPDVVVYGLNCPWMKTPQNMTCTLEHMTAKYLREIRKRQPHGPYYFGGWSAGGIVAYEAAQQLLRQGEEVARLILIDSPNPIGLENPPQRMYDFFDSLDFFGTNGKAPPDWLRPHFNAFLTLLDDYEIQPFSGPSLNTHIIYARDGICKNPGDPRPEVRPDDPREMIWLLNNRTDFSGSGWASLVGTRNLKISVLDDVNHFSMVAPGPRMEGLGAFIRGALK